MRPEHTGGLPNQPPNITGDDTPPGAVPTHNRHEGGTPLGHVPTQNRHEGDTPTGHRPTCIEGDTPPSDSPKSNRPDGGTLPSGIPTQQPGDDAHLDEQWDRPPTVLDMEHFCRVNCLIHQEKDDELLLIKDDDRSPPVNLMKDPVLSVVIACRKTQLAIRLIQKTHDRSRLEKQNYYGDTALHVATAMNDHEVVKALVAKSGKLVDVQNKKQETALHKAALNGHRNLFWWLVREGKSSAQSRRKDGATMLHCAIMGNAPALALEIAEEYEMLITSRNENAVTPLQLMVTIPDLFRSKLVLGSLDELIYNWIPIEVNEDTSERRRRGDEEGGSAKVCHGAGSIKEADDDLYWERIRTKFPSTCTTFLDLLELITIPAGWTRTILLNILRPVFPRIQSLEKKKKKHKEAMELTAYLALPNFMDFYEQGRSGTGTVLGLPESTQKTSEEKNPAPKDTDQKKDDKGLVRDCCCCCKKDDKSGTDKKVERWNEPPLILGAQMGLDDFVAKILQVCPQSVAYLDTGRKSVVRVAIEYGSRNIVRIIHKMARGDNPTLPSWLFSSFHHESKETILHLASAKCTEHAEDAVQMQDELVWFETVEEMIPKELVYSRNKDEKTAQELFTETHQKMFTDCKNQLTEMGKTCSGLVAAVVFASSFSIPGEKDERTGNPFYFHRLPFKIFSHAYVIGLSCAATSLVLFLSLVISPYKEKQFRRAIPTKYYFACLSFVVSLMAFLLSFTCNMFLQIYGGQKAETKDIVPLILELLTLPVVCSLVLVYRGSSFFPSFARRLR